MKVRKVKELHKTLIKKGFEVIPEKKHHNYLVLIVDGKKQNIHTYFSHSIKEYGNTLMTQVKKQLKFNDNQKAEDFFDCPMSYDDYVIMLRENGHI